MSLRRVDLSTDVYFVCLNHSMCTEGEEIVGLLVGEVDEERVAHVVAVLILRRSDKRKDRVEISPEQLSNASTEAEKLACILKRPVRVIGWYHSHPKLTVYPSLVDVCTQESYQLMDEGFIGMIFSVFNPDPNKFGGRIQMICYQSQSVIIDCNVEKSHVEIPIQLVPSSYISDVCMNSIVQLPRFLCQEEQLAYQMANQVPLDYLTRLHNSSVYLRKMGQIAEVICGPLLKMLEERILNNEMKRKRLQERKKALTAQIEKVKRENAQREQEMQEKARLKEQEKAEKAYIREQEMIENVGLEKQNIRAESQIKEKEIASTSEIKKQGMTVPIQVVEQVIMTSPQLKDQELIMPIEQEDIQLGDQRVQEVPPKDKEVEEQALLKDPDIQNTCPKQQKMQFGHVLEEQIILEDYHIQDHDMQEFPQLQEEICEMREQGKPNKPCVPDKKIQELQSKSEETLKNDECKGEELKKNILEKKSELELKNVQEEIQASKKKVQNIIKGNVEDEEKIQLKKQDVAQKIFFGKKESSALASVPSDESMLLNKPTPSDVQHKCAPEFIKSVENLSVTDVKNEHENRSDISKCNIEEVPKISSLDKKFDSNTGQKSDEKNCSPPVKIAQVKSCSPDVSDINAPPIFSSVMQDTPAMEANSSNIMKKEASHD